MLEQCPRCGRPHPQGERFCARCGADLSPQAWLPGVPVAGAPAPTVAAPPAPPAAPGWQPVDHTTLRAPAPPPPAPPRRGRAGMLVVGIVVAVALIGGAVAGLWFLSARGSGSATTARTEASPATAPATSAPASPAPATSTEAKVTVTVTTSPPSPTTPPPSPTAPPPPPDPLQELQRLRNEGVAQLTLDGHWVVQLASKYDGVVDVTQTALDGSHTFHNDDILAEHVTLRARFGNAVKLISGNDMGKRSTRPQALWMTIYDPGTFAGQAAAAAWCKAAFPGLSGSALDNVCLTRQAKPPYD